MFSLVLAAAAVHYSTVPQMLAALPESCLPCAAFFRVERPLVEDVLDHAYVGARFTDECSQALAETEYGLSKGEEDLAHFDGKTEREGLRLIGSLCGRAELSAAHADAAAVTDYWVDREADPVQYYWDMLVTPVAGRPCGNAADDVEAALLPHLEP